MKRRTFLASLATGAALGAAHKLCGSDDDLTIKLPYKAPETSAKRSAKATSVDYDVLLWAIAEKETGNRDDVVGPCGSRSKYQISEAVWRQHVRAADHATAFIWGCDGEFARQLALKHLRWLEANLVVICEDCPYVYHLPSACNRCAYVLAWCWRGGLTAWKRAHGNRAGMTDAASAHKAYAIAVASLYSDRLRSTAT